MDGKICGMDAAGSASTGTVASLQISLLDGLSLRYGDQPVAVDAPRMRSLLAYLVLRRGPQPRERLAFTFWPDSDESQARTNLRQAVHLLRRTLPEVDRFLSTDARAVGWRADAPFTVDVEELEKEVARAKAARDDGDAAEERSALESAASFYAGDLLPECYDAWLESDRERLRDVFLAVVIRLSEVHELERDYRGAIPWARRWLDGDPLNEEAGLRLMRLHALSGDRAAALRVYHGCATAMARELGVVPGTSMTQTYTRLLEGEAPSEPSAAPGAVSAGSPLVGRTAEWEVLRNLWQRAVDGESLLAVITGEAGMGKSRLAEELLGWVRHQGFATAVSQCYLAAGGLAYAPVVELLRSPAIGPRLRRLDKPWLVELTRLLPELGSEHPDLVPSAPMVDDWHRARLFDALSQAVLAEARPLLLVVEDLQWCDQDTLGWLGYLQASSPRAPLLVIGTARSEDAGPEHPLRRSLLLAPQATGRTVDLELTPLDHDETATLAANVSGRPLDEARTRRLHRETEGNPLFVVEWVRAGLTDESADEDRVSDGELMPPGARAVIEARLAQLSTTGQELAGLAATVGRAFTFDLLTRASSHPEERVVETLDELWRRRIVRERGSDAYDFSHDKLREEAYRRISPARRRLLHRRVAQAMERLHAGDLNGVSGQLAAHYEQAGWTDRAIDFYARAATVAQGVYANDEAIGALSRALALLDDEPPTRERAKRELALRTALGVALVVLKGYGTSEVTATYARAMELCGELDEPPTAPILRGTGLSALVRGELPLGHDVAMRLLELGERDDDPMVQVEGHYLLGVTAFWLGDLAEARDQLERAIAVYAPERVREHLASYSQDPRVICLSRLAYTLWHLGDSHGARQRSSEAMRLAEQLEHPFSLGYALTFASWLAIDSGDEDRALLLSERLTGLADERQLGFLQPLGTILSGWRNVSDGRVDEGVAMIHQGLDLYRRTGQPLYLPWSLRLLTEVSIATGQLAAARAALTEAFEVVEATDQRFLEADLHRLSGDLVLLEGGDTTEAETSFTRAIEVARSQGAVQLERRAVAGLERLRAANR